MQRKKIVVSEIKYWKQSKLLPEHYCDFLIALYSHGDEMEKEEEKVVESILAKEKKRLKRMTFLLILLTVITSVSLFIFVDYQALSLAVAAGVLLLLLSFAVRKRTEWSVVIPLFYIASAFILLAMSLKLWSLFFQDQAMLLIGLLIINCVLWLFAGKLLNLLYFTISGIAGILLIVGFLLLQF